MMMGDQLPLLSFLLAPLMLVPVLELDLLEQIRPMSAPNDVDTYRVRLGNE
jgi:hypothetical protein